MNIYEKLQTCRCELQKMNLKKTGENKHTHYKYFELSDFLPVVNELFLKYKICAVLKFTEIEAIMEITDIDNIEKEDIVITSPMKEAKVPGCQPIQNLGAVETYQRRYLYMVALEITEPDILEKMHDKKAKIEPEKTNKDKEADKKNTAQVVANLKEVAKQQGVNPDVLEAFFKDVVQKEKWDTNKLEIFVSEMKAGIAVKLVEYAERKELDAVLFVTPEEKK